MAEISYFERVKFQSDILLPLFKILSSEFGKDKAAELLRAAVREFAASLGKKISEKEEDSSMEKLISFFPAFTADEALELETLRSTPEELSVNVTRCKYAEYFASIGESEFGAMITCEIDPPMTEAIGSDLKLARSKTIASGGDHCDFRWVSEK